MARILIVDDEVFNLKILDEDLKDQGHDNILVEDGKQAVDLLKDDPDFDLILLDRMMPVMDGIEVMHYLNADPELSTIPVIMQTAAASVEQIQEGVELGVFYYLTKPFEKDNMLSIVDNALLHSEEHKKLKENIIEGETALPLMKTASFEFSTIIEARNLATLLASTYKDHGSMAIALQEILLNAIEHGTLGISYEEKKEHLEQGSWEGFIAKKMNDPTVHDKKAYLNFTRTDTEIIITVKDEGDGFDYINFDEITTDRLFDPNGRGIMTAKSLFSRVTYLGKGNEVECVVAL